MTAMQVPPCEHEVVTRTADDYVLIPTKSGFQMKIPAGYVTTLDTKGCSVSSIVLLLYWIDGGFKPLKVNNKDQSIPSDAELAVLGISFNEPTSPTPRPLRETAPWRFEGAYPLSDLGMVVYPNFTKPTAEFVSSIQPDRWIGMQNVKSVMQEKFFFNCQIPRGASTDEIIEFSTPRGGFCRGGWTIAPGAGGPLDIRGDRVLSDMRAKVEQIEALTQSFIVRDQPPN